MRTRSLSTGSQSLNTTVHARRTRTVKAAVASVIEQLETRRLLTTLVWDPTVSAAWDHTSANWIDTATSTHTTFTDGDDVRFTDAGLGAGGANIIIEAGGVSPNTASFENNVFYLGMNGGGITGSASITKTGNALLDNWGSSHSYTGSTTINSGRMRLGNGSTNLPDGSDVVLGAAGELQIDGNETIGSLAGSGKVISNGMTTGGNNASTNYSGLYTGVAFKKVGTGTMTLSGSTPAGWSGQIALFGGTLELNKTPGVNAIPGSGTSVFIDNGATLKWLASDQVSDAAGIVNFNGTLDANGNSETFSGMTMDTATAVTKTGVGGSLTLTAATLYRGSLLVDALGSFNVTTTQFGSGDAVMTADIYGTLNIGSGGNTMFDNFDGSLTKLDVHSGGVVNTSTGLFRLAGSQHVVEAGGVINVGTGGMFTSNPINTLTLNADALLPGTLNLNGDLTTGGVFGNAINSGEVGALPGVVNLLGNRTINVSTGILDVSARLSVAAGDTSTVTSAGGSQLRLQRAQSLAGSLAVPGTVNLNANNLSIAGTLSGTGTITGAGTTTSSGTASPGASNGTTIGTLNTSTITLAAGSSYSAQLGATSDQLNVTGIVSLGGSNLNLSGAAPNASYILINNDGVDPVLGTFNGLPSGALVSLGARVFSISYAGGDGNDVALVDALVVTNTNNAGAGSLRQVITNANTLAGANTISFNIPGAGVRTIAPTSALPTITDTVTLDATTQPGFGGSPLIELSGTSAGAGSNGLTLTGSGSSGSTIRGFIVNRFSGEGIRLTGNTANDVIAGNWVGLNSTGTVAAGNVGVGIDVINAGSGNRVGGTSAADRNVVGGNSNEGIVFRSSPNGVIQGNYVGTNITGTAAVGNNIGILVTLTTGATIGGTAAGAGNLVSGNRNNGISLLGTVATPVTGCVIQGNFTGTQAGGTGSIPNALFGINVSTQSNNNTVGGLTSAARNISCYNVAGGVNIGADGNVVQGNWIGVDAAGNAAGNSSRGVNIAGSNNTIGGTAAGAPNIIAFNSTPPNGNGFGVVVNSGTGNAIRRNSIYSNGKLGIDLLPPVGVNPNDPNDPDVGGNNLQNYPVITSATPSGGGTLIQGTLNSTPNATFVIEIFSNTVADPSGFGEGETFLTDTTVTTDALGNASFSVTVSPALALGTPITATATSSTGNTSEFSAALSNQLPVANDDSYTVNEDGALVANDADGTTNGDANDNGVLANDTDANNDSLTAIEVSSPTHGVLVLNSNGTFTYTPNANYFGPDSFTYKANDGQGDSNVATVNINVTAVNDNPDAVDDSATVVEGSSVIIPVLNNDTDVENDTLTVSGKTDGAHGTVVINGDGTLTYTHDGSETMSDSFTYTVSDGNGGTDTATVNLTITPANDAPEIDSVTIAPTSPATNDTLTASVTSHDDDGDSVTYGYQWFKNGVAIGGQTASTLDLSQAGNGDHGDSITVQVTPNDGTVDGATATSNTATVVNSAPVANDDSPSTPEDAVLTDNVLTNDTDLDGDSLTAVQNSGPTHGTLVLNANGSYSYTPDANYYGTDSFTYHANDGQANSNVATVTITITSVNDAPVIDSVTIAPVSPATNDTLTATVTSHDDDGDSVTYGYQWFKNGVAISGQTGSTLDLSQAGNGDHGDSITVKVTPNDGTVNGATATSNTAVIVNTGPVANNDNPAAIDEDTTLTGNVLSNDSDLDNDTLIAVQNSGPAHGTLVLNPNGTFTYTPNANYNGSDTFTYHASDGQFDSNIASVSINVLPKQDAPTITVNNSSVAVNETQTGTNSGTYNDVDFDTVVLTASEGTVTKSGTSSGTWNWSKATTDNEASHVVTITSNDGHGGVASVTFTLTANNVAPTATANTYSTPQGTAVSGNVISNNTGAGVDSDPAGANDPLNVSAVNGGAGNVGVATATAHGSVIVNANGTFTYTPASTYTGADSFTYTISDGDGGSSTATVALTISAPGSTGGGSITTITDTCMGGTALLIIGTNGADNIHVSPGSGSTLSITINGVTTTRPEPSGRIIIFGLDGNDMIQLAGSIDNETWLYGDAGNDSLNLGNGGGIEFGGAGNDELLGGSGRDVLVGGSGADRLVGNPGDDIMIAGYTDYDDRNGAANHDDAWCHIYEEWNRTDANYTTRISHEEFGTGLNGAYRLNANDAAGANTVHDDTAQDILDIDTLTGSSGEDWFLANTTGSGSIDKITGNVKGEVTSDV